MKIIKAEKEQLDIVENITLTTIKTVYPHYYPVGAVNFFIEHHRTENIMSDIRNGFVFILVDDADVCAGTVTIKMNEINRLFVLPEFQGKGYGRLLLDFAETSIFKNYDEIVISSSLPAKSIYLKRNYKETSFHTIDTENGDRLCYDEMRKYRN